MADDARAPEIDQLDFEVELVSVADLADDEWDDDLRAAVAEA